MLTSRQFVLAVLAVALCVVAGPTQAAPRPAPGAVKGVKVDPLVPTDSENLMAFEIRKVLGAKMVKAQVPMLKMLVKGNDDVNTLLTQIGLDPFKDIDSITVSNKGSNGANVLIVVRGRFQPDKIHTAASKYAKANPDKLSISKVGGVQVYKAETDNQPLVAAFADKNTLVATTSKANTLKYVKIAGKAGGRLNKALGSAVSGLSGKEGVWIASVITDEMKKAMSSNPQLATVAPKLKSMSAGVTLGDDNALAEIKINTSDTRAAAQVKKLLMQAKPLLQLIAQNNEQAGPFLGELLDNLKITTDKSTVLLTLKVTEKLINKAQEGSNP